METTQQQSLLECSCGRKYTHCHWCGKRNLYPLKTKSLLRSIELGQQLTVYRCKKCGRETDNAVTCIAAKDSFVTDFVPFQKEKVELIPGSIEYAAAMNEWVSEYSHKKSINVNKAFCEAKRQGWQPELYDMEDDLREELELAGLIPATAKPLAEQTEPLESAVSLDDIIKNLQENSK